MPSFSTCPCIPLHFHTCAVVNCTHSIPLILGRKAYGGEVCKKYCRHLQKVVIGIVEDWREVQMELRLIREDV
jgi:hypothetical protein